MWECAMRFPQSDLHPPLWISRCSPSNWDRPPMNRGFTPLIHNGAHEKTPLGQSQHTRSIRITWQGAAL
ncbi:hypothetical protein NITLEN_20082 [Nitrospira lenta]|uniref:Uncharacterized protein n=1 Tax=Nitrospira lenta TaxID=1436998 RepID=A0A330L3V2_9BACT|nr:hypothetical protein NITLEN_20082 [Nitrospira lenta]